MTTVLESIIEGVREDLAKRQLPINQLNEAIAEAKPALDVYSAIATPSMSIIAEVKRSSPSKGDLAAISDPAALAREYEDAGASVVSVLTEERRFKGSIADFRSVRKEVSLPLLRKDFIVTQYQVMESRAIGADLQLLIVAGLAQSELRDFYQLSHELGMGVLVEIHNNEELERAMDIAPQGPRMIGVNARNLKTLEVDLTAFETLLPQIPETILRVAESGISQRSEVAAVEELGANAILVGETLVRATSPAQGIGSLLGR
jgi:indole-3-glycerol phosphate synthase